MWFQTSFDSLTNRTSRRPSRRAGRTADRRLEARRLLLEGLEDRSLLAFNPFAEYATGAAPYDVTLADVNGDTRQDLIVANIAGNSIDVRLGNADGTFGSAQTSPTGANPRSVATGDFTGDGIPDVITANAADVSVLAGNGDGTFQPPQSISLPGQFPPGYADADPRPQLPLSVATGDLNADGKLDLVVGADTYFSQLSCYWGYYGGYYCNYFNSYDGYVNVLLGNGSGGVDSTQTHHLGSSRFPNAVAVGDINGDTNDDVLTANNYDLSALLGDGTGAVGSPNHSGSGYGLRSVSLGDLDGDGKIDTLSSSGYGLYVQKGDGLGGFTPQPHVSAGIPVNSAVMGDVNDDGKLDLVAAGSRNEFHCTSYGYWGCYDGYSTSTRQTSVLLGNGLGNFALPLTNNIGAESNYGWLADVAVGNLNGDSLPELVTVDYYANEAIVATNDGDWDPPPSIAISDAAIVVEGDSGAIDAVFTVTIVGDHNGVSVDYSTGDYSAAAGADYTAQSGTLIFGVGEFSQTISVPVQGDTIDEYDEQFFVSLSNAAGGQITDSSGTGTIQDDDTDPVLSISDVPTIVEGNSGTLNAVFTVTLAGERKGGVVTVDYSTFDSGAAAGADYTATSGTLTFAVDETSKEISVPILGDTIDEYDEQFYVGLSNPAQAQISAYYGIGTIQDDDDAPTLSINDVSRNEGNNRHNTSFEFTVSLSAISGKWVSVNVNTADGTATVADSDYYGASGTVYIEPGTMSETFTVTVRGDKKKEAHETFVVNLSAASEATISDSQGVGTITNDDGGRGKPNSSLALLVDDTLTTTRKRK